MRPRDVLAANLVKLMAAAKVSGLSTFPDLVEASSGALTNGTLDRVRRAKSATSVDTLEGIANVFGVEPWQLLVPSLHAEPAMSSKQKVRLSGLPDWPFKYVPKDDWDALGPDQRIRLEGRIEQLLAEISPMPTAEALRVLEETERQSQALVKPIAKRRRS